MRWLAIGDTINMVEKIEILNAIKEDTLYDFVSNEYYRMDKKDLVDLVKELAYAIDVVTYRRHSINVEIREEFLENLKELWEEEI